MAVHTINTKFRTVPHPAGADGRPPSDRQGRLAEMFGIGLDETHEVTLYDALVLDVRPGDVVFITGPSGTGKSVLLRALVRAVRDAAPDGGRVVDLARLHLATDRPCVDLPTAPLERALHLFSTAGLADAFALLRPAPELSDGQRYRLRLALALDRLLAAPDATECSPTGAGVPPMSCQSVPRHPSARLDEQTVAPAAPRRVLVADEFCSTLDRCCARALAYRVRRLVDRSRNNPEGTPLTVLAASAHDDLVADLDPDVLVVTREGEGAEVRYADPSWGGEEGNR
jgi:ABC-type ATPase with predicted acetyltransferase domain